MQGYYLHYRDICNSNRVQTGIDKKVASQIAAFNRAGLNCKFVFCPQPETTLSMVRSCLPLFPDGIRWPQPEELRDADYIYIRRPRFASKELIRFLKGFRKFNPNALIIYEIPSFPYDAEMKPIKFRAALAKDRRWRAQLKGHVDYMADLSGVHEIFGIPTIQFVNGIDLETVRPRVGASYGDELHLVFAAYFEHWHGADRVIEGLARYYSVETPDREVILHMCGGGSLLPSLKNLARQHSLDSHIVFHGPLDFDELNIIYDKCSMAIASLGFHRIANPVASTLKSREYLAKGIPFVYAGDIDLFLKDPVSFCLCIPSGDDPVDIGEIVSFYDRLLESCTQAELTASIRAYAERHVSIDAAMSSVIALIKDHCG